MIFQSNFDGISCAYQAALKAGLTVTKYYATEIDKNAIKVSRKNHPDIIQLGSIQDVHITNMGIEVDVTDSKMNIYEGVPDVILGGSPCQGLSRGNSKRLHLLDDRSKLFYDFVRLVDQAKLCNPDVYFLFENVKMNAESMQIVTEALGVQPVYINSSWFGAQQRERFYWTNIPIPELPLFNPLTLRDILLPSSDSSLLSEKGLAYMFKPHRGKPRYRNYQNPLDSKARCLTANMKKGVPYGVLINEKRFITPEECEVLQGLPIGYTDNCGLSFHQRRSLCGNGWTVDVIAHILQGLNQKQRNSFVN